jgi:hypothetical protein
MFYDETTLPSFLPWLHNKDDFISRHSRCSVPQVSAKRAESPDCLLSLNVEVLTGDFLNNCSRKIVRGSLTWKGHDRTHTIL